VVTAVQPVLLWTPTQGKPNARQAEARQLLVDLPDGDWELLGYGGASGGGKSVIIANLAITVALECPGSRSLVGRKTLISLKSTTLLTFDLVLATMNGLAPHVRIRKRESGPVARYLRKDDWPPGVWSEVVFMGVEKAKDKIGSEEFGWVFLDESHEIDEMDARYLFTRLRHKPERKRGMVICFNPFPGFAVEWFIDQEGLPADLMELGRLHLHFVPARWQDNQENLPPGYADMEYAGLEDYLRAVMIEGRGEAVPKAIFAELHNPELMAEFQVKESGAVEGAPYVYGMTGWDWGTSKTHLAAGVIGAVDKHDLVWILDAWESPFGSSTELETVALEWRQHWGRAGPKDNRLRRGFNMGARYDSSQGSLKDNLERVFDDVDKGIRDVDGRIRLARGILSEQRFRFNWQSEGVRKLWRYLTLYHRDDDDEVVEKLDDMIDAFMYMLAGLPTTVRSTAQEPRTYAQGVRWKGAARPKGMKPRKIIGGAA